MTVSFHRHKSRKLYRKNNRVSYKSGHSILHPITHEILQPADFIIFDAPLGRLHQQTGKYIDLWMHIEVPLDVSLCRRMLRDFKEEKREKTELLEELEFYLNEARPLFFDEQLKKNADFILDGMVATKFQVELINQFLSEGKTGNANESYY